MFVFAGPLPNSEHPPVTSAVVPGQAADVETAHPPAHIAELLIAVTKDAGLNCFPHTPD